MLLAIEFPSWITPEVFPGVHIPLIENIRWYGVMYVFAFATAYFVFKKRVKEGALHYGSFNATDDNVFSFFTWGILGLLLGARLFSVFVYDTSGIYLTQPWLIFWPFDETGFIGLAGMSYHGGVVGGFLGMLFWCLKHKQPVFKWIDVMAISIPLGYTFGRLGNFINGELFGRVTTMPWGIVFPHAERFSASLPWVQTVIEKAHLTVPANALLVNLPRHPSQLYEALFEGIVLWVILWLLRKKAPFSGFLTAVYLIGYGLARFIIEYFREPDADLGYRITAQGAADAPLYFNVSLLNLSTGQILCLGMIGAGLILLIVMGFLHKKNLKK